MTDFREKGDKELRRRNLERAGGRCELCKSTYMPDNHHLLPKSVYPQHRFEKMNTAILCRFRCHNLAENHPLDFWEAIKDNPAFQERVEWVSEHKDVNKHPYDYDYEEMYNELMESE